MFDRFGQRGGVGSSVVAGTTANAFGSLAQRKIPGDERVGADVAQKQFEEPVSILAQRLEFVLSEDSIQESHQLTTHRAIGVGEPAGDSLQNPSRLRGP